MSRSIHIKTLAVVILRWHFYRSKNREMGPNQASKLLLSKGNITVTKRQPMDWEKLFANDTTDKSLIF